MRALGAAVVLALAGCGGGEEPRGTPVPIESGRPAPELGGVLLRFAEAAQRRDAAGMWELLSTPSQESLGPTFAAFRHSASVAISDSLGDASGLDVVFARRVGEIGVAAVVGEVVEDDDRSDYAYGSALVREGGAWRLEVGGAVATPLAPVPEEETDSTPRLKAVFQAPRPVERVLLWLDGEPVEARREDDGLLTAYFEAHASGLEDGRHVLVAFGQAGEFVAASAWPFRVAG